MARRHLHELLREEQEPFLLKSYINERRCQLRRPSSKSHLQLKERTPTSQNHSFPTNTCKSPRLFPFRDSSDPRKSPLLDLSAAKSPSLASRTTAYLLLEAALRIQQQQRSKPRSSIRGFGFGFFASILKRLVLRKRRREIGGEENRVLVTDFPRWDDTSAEGESRETEVIAKCLEGNEVSEMGFSDYICGNEIQDESTDSERNSQKMGSLDEKEGYSDSHEKGLSSSPSWFLPASSSDNRSPVFASPVGSPVLRETERQLFGGTRDDESSIGVKEKKEEEEVDEQKEQLSPVSVLDPTFECQPQGHVDSFQHSLFVVQRAKLMNHLRRFERLAGLDPIELDMIMAEGTDSDDQSDASQQLEIEDLQEFVTEILAQAQAQAQAGGCGGCRCIGRIPTDMKKLVLDLVEEEREGIALPDEEVIVAKVWKRLEAWKVVELNTIDMMVELDFRREGEEWKRYEEQVQETSELMEFAIFGLLVDELFVELSHSIDRPCMTITLTD